MPTPEETGPDALSVLVDSLVATRINGAITQIIVPKLEAMTQRFQGAIPAEEAIVQRVILALRSTPAQAVHSNGTVQASDAVPPSTPVNTGDPKAGEHLLDRLIPILDYAFTKILEWQKLKYEQTDVFALAAQLQAARPLHASVLGQLLAPDPMAQHVPAIMAHTAMTTWDAARNATARALTGGVQAVPPGQTSSPSPNTAGGLSEALPNPLGPPSPGSPPAGGRIPGPIAGPSEGVERPNEVVLFREWARGGR
jgi:hypothetical protein